MTNVMYELRNLDGEVIAESKYFYEIKNDLIQDIINDMWGDNKEELIDNCYSGVEIAGDYYSAYNIVDSLGNVDDVVESILKDEFWNLHEPELGEESTEVVDYGYKISCRALISHEIVTISVVNGIPTIASETTTDNDEFNFKVLDLYKAGWTLVGDVFRSDEIVRACLIKAEVA